MRIGLISDISFYDKFRNHKQQDEVFIFYSLDDIRFSVDYLIVDSKYIPANIFINFIEKQNTMKYFYILSKSDTPMTITLLKSKGIVMIPPMLTAIQIIDKIYQNIQGESHNENNNVIVFIGADNKVGTSMITQSISEKLSMENQMKILHVILDGQPGLDYIHHTNHALGIDGIKGKIAHHILNSEELLSVCIKKNSLYIMQGTQSILNRNHYHPEHIQNFLELASQTFDIVLIDAGSNVELGMTIGALNSTQHKCLIATQQRNCLKHFESVNSQILSKLNIQDFVLIVNKYMDNNELPDGYTLSKYYDAPVIGLVPYSEYGWQAEIEQCSLLNFNECKYKEAIHTITSFIEKVLKIEKETEKRETRSFLSKIFRKQKRLLETEKTI